MYYFCINDVPDDFFRGKASEKINRGNIGATIEC